MIKPISLSILLIYKYLFMGVKISIDSAFYNLITVKPIKCVADSWAAFQLLFHLAVIVPLAIFFNLLAITGFWFFNKERFYQHIEYAKNEYSEAVDLLAHDYKVYRDTITKN